VNIPGYYYHGTNGARPATFDRFKCCLPASTAPLTSASLQLLLLLQLRYLITNSTSATSKSGTTSSPPSILANNPLTLTGVAGVIGDVAVDVVVVAVEVMGGETGVEAAVKRRKTKLG
jgi:hypothetical protein